jgi:SSS family solute:Na+ symporter
MKQLDLIVFAIYFVIVASYGYWIYHKKRKTAVSASTIIFLQKDRLPGGPSVLR